MVVLEFNKEDIAVLKMAAEEYHKSGAEKCRFIIRNAGMDVKISNDVRKLSVPAAKNDILGNDGCYSCVTCGGWWPVALVALASLSE